MPKRSRKPRADEVSSAFDTLQHIIGLTEPQATERVAALERLCSEVRQFGEVAKLPPRVLDALLAAAMGQAVPETLLPVNPAEDFPEPDSLAAVALGRRGGLKGGAARAAALSARRRKAIAKKAASARWAKAKE